MRGWGRDLSAVRIKDKCIEIAKSSRADKNAAIRISEEVR